MAKKPQPSVSTCECGYAFSYTTSIRRRQFESFAVIRDKDYQRFLKLEQKVLEAPGQETFLRAVGKSSKYVGSLIECPECGRLLLIKPGGDPKVYHPSEE